MNSKIFRRSLLLLCTFTLLLSICCGGAPQASKPNANANTAVVNSTVQSTSTGNFDANSATPTPMGVYPSSHDLETALKTRLKIEDPTVLDDGDLPAANKASWSGKVWLDLNLGDFCRQNGDIARRIVVDATANALEPFNLRLRDDAKRRLQDVSASTKCSDALKVMASTKYETLPISRRP